FSPSTTNAGTSPAYQWKLNGTNVATSLTYSTNTLVNGDVVSCVLTSNAVCATPTTANSNNITMAVSPLVTPLVSISATPTTICSGSTVTFTAAASASGSTPAYQWKKNGINVGANSTT